MAGVNEGRAIAVIGGGVAGLGAAWALAGRHRVTLYDREARFGGHANTIDVDSGGQTVAVDTGFIVYNELNYPHLVALFDRLGVDTAPSDMSFGVSLRGGGFEYSGADLNGLFAQRRNTLSPRFWRMLKDIERFYRKAPAYRHGIARECSIGELLDGERYSSAFIDGHLIPMASAIWSATRSDIRAYPADAFIDFFDNHGLLNLRQRPQWRTVTGGSREYVRKLLASAPIECAPACEVAAVRRYADGVMVVDDAGGARVFDEVVIATHADQALRLLDDASAAECAVLDAFRYTANRAWLHEDTTLMPRRRAAWSSWNYLQPAADDACAPLCVTYWMNRLQPLPTARDLFVTLNPTRKPRADLVHGCFDYDHPVFTQTTAAAQRASADIQGVRRTWFCGSYLGHGFHEDALQSGLWVAGKLGAPPAWSHAASFDRLPATYCRELTRAA